MCIPIALSMYANHQIIAIKYNKSMKCSFLYLSIAYHTNGDLANDK